MPDASRVKHCELCRMPRPAHEQACRFCECGCFGEIVDAELVERLIAQNRWQDAFSFCEDAVARNPGGSEVCVRLAWLAYVVRDFRAVEVWSHEAQRQHPELPDAHILLGTVLKAAGRWEESLQEFDAALSKLDDETARKKHVADRRADARSHLPEWW